MILILSATTEAASTIPVTTEMNELAAQLGIATLLFFALITIASVLILYIRSQSREAEKRIETNRQTYDKIIETIRTDREHDQQILLGALEDNREQIAIVSKAVESMKAQSQAINVLLDKTSRLLETRCIHQMNKP
jgi:uncharacterized protein YpmS